MATGSTTALTASRDALAAAIAEVSALDMSDSDCPQVFKFEIGRKAVEFVGPLRKAEALSYLAAELRRTDEALNAASHSAKSSFFRAGL